MYRSKVCVQEFWCIVSGLDIQPEQSDYDNPARKKKKAVPKCVFHVARYDDSCTVFFVELVPIYGSLVKTSHSESDNIGSNLAGCHSAWHYFSSYQTRGMAFAPLACTSFGQQAPEMRETKLPMIVADRAAQRVVSLPGFSLPAAADLPGVVDEHAPLLQLYQRRRQRLFR